MIQPDAHQCSHREPTGGTTDEARIRIGPGGFLLPYYHPAALANRVALMDHLSDGRLNFGIAASGLPSDWEMFGVDGFGGENREMTAEAIDIIMHMWSEEPGWHNWIIGSVDTVVEKIEKMYADVGGFGHLLLFGFDYADKPEDWRRSMELLGTEVKPRLAHLTGE